MRNLTNLTHRTIKMKKLLLLSLTSFLTVNLGFGQCPPGQAEVTLEVSTDDYGYEGYWEIVPTGNGCGNGTVAFGGNSSVGCSGAGNQNQTPGGYGNNQTITEGPWCLTLGDCFDLHFMDDWGDGGFTFKIFVNGFQVETFEGITGLNESFAFCVAEPDPYDVSIYESNVPMYVAVGSFNLNASLFNYGSSVINSYDLNYMVNGGAVQTHNVTGSSVANYQSEQSQHSIPVNVPSNGNYEIKIWADNLNGGNNDSNNQNDTLTVAFEAGPGIPNVLDGYIGQSVSIESIAGNAQQVNAPTDLDFHPVLTRKELWVCNKGTENSGGSTVTIFDAGEGTQTTQYKQDGNAWHFMSLPTGLAFSSNGNWATSPGVYDANHDGGSAFTGPSLWSSDMNVYAEPSGGNGSHLDMLHLSPYSQGIASEIDNVFWVFDGYSGDIVRYDFVEDHGPGNSFHGDAIVRRFSDDAVQRDQTGQIVSHLVLDENKQWLYTVDHGNQRVIRIDITTGSDQGGTPQYPMNETIAEYTVYTGYTQETVVTGLSKPAGIDVIGNRMIVSEHQSGEIILYDISSVPAVELERINTGMSSVQGIKIGPDGKIWFVDEDTDGVYRVNSPGVGLDENTISFEVYPNPSNGEVHVVSDQLQNGTIEVRDVHGKLITSTPVQNAHTTLSLNVLSGMYFVRIVQDDFKSDVKRLVIH